MHRLAWWRSQVFRCQRHLIDHRGIVAQLHVELPTLRMRYRQHVTWKPIRHFAPDDRTADRWRPNPPETDSIRSACIVRRRPPGTSDRAAPADAPASPVAASLQPCHSPRCETSAAQTPNRQMPSPDPASPAPPVRSPASCRRCPGSASSKMPRPRWPLQFAPRAGRSPATAPAR